MSDMPQLVWIEWVDSRVPAAGWQKLSDIDTRAGQKCVSVGFLVREDAHAKVIAPNLSADGNGDWDQASGLITIPAAAITLFKPIGMLFQMAPKPRPLADAQWLRRLA